MPPDCSQPDSQLCITIHAYARVRTIRWSILFDTACTVFWCGCSIVSLLYPVRESAQWAFCEGRSSEGDAAQLQRIHSVDMCIGVCVRGQWPSARDQRAPADPGSRIPHWCIFIVWSFHANCIVGGSLMT
jgi:hypothetical protein